MKIKAGYLYHIKDEVFDKVNDNGLLLNHEKGKTRPTYFIIKDGDILWFIPLSSKIQKYKNIYNNKIRKYGRCDSILIEKVFDEDSAILIQNAFPTLEKYIDHVHTRNGKPALVPITLQEKIYKKFIRLLELKERGIDLFFTDIDKIKEKMLNEIEQKVY